MCYLEDPTGAHCSIWSWTILVQIVIGFHTPWVAVFLLGIWVFIALLFGSYYAFESLISEFIYVLSSHVHPQCHQFIVVLYLAWLFLDFGYLHLLWIFCSLIFLCLLIFSLSSYLFLDLTQIPLLNSIVFKFWSLAVFVSSFSRIPYFTFSVLAVSFQKIIFTHRKFLIIWNMQD